MSRPPTHSGKRYAESCKIKEKCYILTSWFWYEIARGPLICLWKMSRYPGSVAGLIRALRFDEVPCLRSLPAGSSSTVPSVTKWLISIGICLGDRCICMRDRNMTTQCDKVWEIILGRLCKSTFDSNSTCSSISDTVLSKVLRGSYTKEKPLSREDTRGFT